MNKTAIKKYATTARRKLIEAVEQKMRYYGFEESGSLSAADITEHLSASGVHLDNAQAAARAALDKRITAHGFQPVVEEVAYTWFNRLAAIRFMQVNDYLPGGIKILPENGTDRLEPECVREYKRVDFIDQAEAEALKAESDEALYRYILVKQCNDLAKILPGMFSAITGYADLLLPDRLFSKDCVVYDTAHSDIPDDDYKEQVEIIGWLYQYYISEKKDEVFAALKKNVKITKENIPAATQMFTPHWIVRYMVENSLGRLWLQGHPNADLRKEWRYYIDDAEQTPEVKQLLLHLDRNSRDIRPTDIRFIDPCMGSGHILVYAFDLLYQIYVAEGYAERDIPDLILTHNLYGLDIDERACQLAYFALTMKARAYNRRFLRRETTEIPQPCVYATFGNADLEEYGSLTKETDKIVKPVDSESATNLMDFINREERMNEWHCKELLAAKYDVVVTNPPYMGASGMGAKLAEYVKKNYPDSKSDMFSAFIERIGEMLKPFGYQAMITQHAWMFLSSFEKLRGKLLTRDIVNMAHLGKRAFEEVNGEVVQATAFVLNTAKTPGFQGTYARLVDFGSQTDKEDAFLRGAHRYAASADSFVKIPGEPIAYWVSDKLLKCFENKLLGTFGEPKQGFATGDNNRFLRLWHEISRANLGLAMTSAEQAKESNYRWFPCNKGGTYRKWYGNNDIVADWKNGGAEMTAFLGSVIRNPRYYFREGLTWSSLANDLSMRFSPSGFLFESKGSVCFVKDEKYTQYLLGLLNSKQISKILLVLSPTLDFHEGPMARVPIAFDDRKLDDVNALVTTNIALSRADWDAFETSWDFKRHPLIDGGASISAAFDNCERETGERFDTLKANEEALNRIFIDIYGLQDELSPEVEDKDVTVRRADKLRDVKSFISYAVGCMFGRYSLDVEGLAYAGGAWDTSKYTTFIPDKDNVLPINDSIDYFDDDVVVRFAQFVRAVYGEATLEDNLAFIGDTLYPDSARSARDKIRRYFAGDFYKDHIKIYQKKPIYWQFDSGRQGGFKALIYLHRYDRHTVGRVRADYLHPQQRMYEDEIKRIAATNLLPETTPREKADGEKRAEVLRKKMMECREYDAAIAHLALRNIELDLDDGVTANYAKFQSIEVAQGAGRPAMNMDLLTKI